MRVLSWWTVLVLASLLSARPAAACSCIAPERSGFLHPDTTLLPANARGMLFLLTEDRPFDPRRLQVHASAGPRPVPRIEPIDLAPGHPLAQRLYPGDRLVRIGVKGGFNPGVRYTMHYRLKPARGSAAVPLRKASFAVADQPFDIGALRPAIALHGQVTRADVPFATGASCSNELPSLVQGLRISASGADAGTLAGLTVLGESAHAQAAFAPLRHRDDACSVPPAARALRTGAIERVIHAGCAAPQPLQVRAWAGMLEVDERMVATAPLQVDWAGAPPGACTPFGQLREALQRGDMADARRRACALDFVEQPGYDDETGPSAQQWRSLLHAPGEAASCAARALGNYVEGAARPDPALVDLLARSMAQRLAESPEDVVEVLRNSSERLVGRASRIRYDNAAMAALPADAFEPLIEPLIEALRLRHLQAEMALRELAVIATTDPARQRVEAGLRRLPLPPAELARLLAAWRAVQQAR